MFDMSGSGQIGAGSLSTGTGGVAYIQSQQMQGVPNQVLSKYGSQHLHQHHGANTSTGGADFDHGVAEHGGGSDPQGSSLVHQTMSGHKVRLPEIAYGVSHSTVVSNTEGSQKLNKTMNNYNSDPYALRLN